MLFRSMYGIKPADLEAQLETLELVDEYLERIGKPHQYTFVSDAKLAFDPLYKVLRSLRRDQMKLDLAKQIGFRLICYGGASGGRVYGRVRKIATCIESIPFEVGSKLGMPGPRGRAGRPSTSEAQTQAKKLVAKLESGNPEHDSEKVVLGFENALARREEKAERKQSLECVQRAHNALVEATNSLDGPTHLVAILGKLKDIEGAIRDLRSAVRKYR